MTYNRPNLKTPAILCAIYFAFHAMSAVAQSEPQIFEPGLISNDGVFGFTLSPDTKTALWVSSNGKRDTLRIMESRKIKGKWSAPKVASFSSASAAWKDIDPIFSPDGKTVLFQSNRTDGRVAARNDFDIWLVNWNGNGWDQPYSIGNTVNTEASESYASITNNKTVYFMKDNPDGIGQSDLYFAEFKNGNYQTPQNLGAPINTNARESNPYISPKGDYLLYFSSAESGFGEVDLMISFFREGKWTTPKNLGPPINSELAEFCPFVHQKQKRLYFSRQQKKDSRMYENVYSVDFDARKYK